ncbi:MAG: HAD family hydrolase [Clostridia bacterium]|nr:HAD family hydrolase [Clostridia bacterium]
MKRPKMILFDYGGTILREPDCDFLRGERAVFEHVVKNPRGLTPEDMSRFETRLYREWDAARKLGFEPGELQPLRFKYEFNEIELDVSLAEAENILWDNASPLTEDCRTPHILEALDALRRSGVRSGVVSNIGWSAAALRRRIDLLLPDNGFEFVIASCAYGIRKPDRRLFDLALRKAQLPPEDVWFCGDTFETDIVGAAAAGLTPVFYAPGGDPREGEAPQHAVITDLEQLVEMIG